MTASTCAELGVSSSAQQRSVRALRVPGRRPRQGQRSRPVLRLWQRLQRRPVAGQECCAQPSAQRAGRHGQRQCPRGWRLVGTHAFFSCGTGQRQRSRAGGAPPTPLDPPTIPSWCLRSRRRHTRTHAARGPVAEAIFASSGAKRCSGREHPWSVEYAYHHESAPFSGSRSYAHGHRRLDRRGASQTRQQGRSTMGCVQSDSTAPQVPQRAAPLRARAPSPARRPAGTASPGPSPRSGWRTTTRASRTSAPAPLAACVPARARRRYCARAEWGPRTVSASAPCGVNTA